MTTIETMEQLRAERDAALKACAEMRTQIQIRHGYMPHDPKACKTCHALSSNCGKGYVSVEQVTPLVEALEASLKWMDKDIGNDSLNADALQCEQALAEWKKITESQTTFANAVDKPPSAV